MIRDILLVGISSLLSFSAGYLIHKNRLPIAENINYYYVKNQTTTENVSGFLTEQQNVLLFTKLELL